jgi:gamma-glutamyl phosphate reductase
MEDGLGGELIITDKLHQRGPIGLQHLVTNKWYIYERDRLGRLHCSVFSNQFKVFTE